MEGVRIKKKLDKKRGAPEEGRGLHFQPIFVLAFLKSEHPSVAFQKKKPNCAVSEEEAERVRGEERARI